MAGIAHVLAQTSAPSGGDVDFSSYIIIAVAVALTAVAMKAVFARRAKRSTAGAVSDGSRGPAIRLAPAPPFPEDVARLRALLGETAPAPRITRYSVPVVTTDDRSLRIRDKKIGEIVAIPLTAIASIEARETSIRPKGTVLPRTYPSLMVTVRHGATELTVALTPIVGAYDKVSQSDVAAMAVELNSRLTATQR